jgi:hypothetical protein
VNRLQHLSSSTRRRVERLEFNVLPHSVNWVTGLNLNRISLWDKSTRIALYQLAGLSEMMCQYQGSKSLEVGYSQTTFCVGSVDYIRIYYRHLAVSSTKVALLKYMLFLCRIHLGSQLTNGKVNPVS